MELIKSEWYESLIDDIQTLRVEGVFNHHWLLIETYHSIGRRIMLEKENFGDMSLEQILQTLAKDIGRGKRMIRYAVKLYEKFPDLDMLPEGKNVTMTKIIDMYLTDGKIEKEPTLYNCPKCGHRDGADAFRD